MYFSSGRNKRGNAITDSLTVLTVMFVFGILSVVGYMVFDDLNSTLQDDPNMGATAKGISSGLYDKYPATLDGAFLTAFVLMVIFAIVSVFVIDTHPIYFILAVVLLIAVFTIGGFLANAYDDIMTEPDLAVYANDFTATGFIMGNLMQVILGVVMVMLVALFAKFRSLT